ncbi:MAG TPA: hypothetical protein VJ992_05025 [Gemmatimonadales bacterium]|nr:hypothetical protein [Gemmatimonadales bacterium]
MPFELIAGAAVALAALALVIEPLARGRSAMQLAEAELDEDDLLPAEEMDSPKMRALIALKEIEFDHATGKLSDEDYESLKAKYSRMALLAMHAEERGEAAPREAPAAGVAAPPLDAAEAMIRQARGGGAATATAAPPVQAKGAAVKSCPQCGPRPEADAVFCSNCGRPLAKAG